MHRRRPCRICRRWFDPHPRAGSAPECQRERHRRSCAELRRKKPDAGRERRLRRRLRAPPIEDSGSGPGRLETMVLRAIAGDFFRLPRAGDEFPVLHPPEDDDQDAALGDGRGEALRADRRVRAGAGA
ncbi:MAG: hypothetical protein KC420_16545, partial [Myxococcales bacterium]|nr:hypothetical protein [Myxococcales bacterium]